MPPDVRFEHAAAYLMGVGLPLLEMARRRTNFSTFFGYVDDFLIGGMLLFAAGVVSRQRRNGPLLLVVAWALLCGGLYASFFGQIESDAALDVSGAPNWVAVAVKGVLYVIAIAGLATSARRVASERTAST